ncbi:MAG TPA: extracellular solute-binding protein [Acidimicrobiales bacterium]|nr:extracellular solute-binding protein [Acidimicrobiales bacterium]
MHTRRGRSTRIRVAALVAAIAAGGFGLAGCSGGNGSNTIVLYNGQHPQLTQALVTAFEAKTGITVRVRTDDGIVLADQILQEGASSPADVYLAENSPELMLLQERHFLSPLPTTVLDQVPAADSSPDGDWVGVALRVCALVYNPSMISASQLPTSVLDLAQPQWKGKLALAPTDSDFPPQVGAVIATYGKQAAQNWLQGLKANASLYQDEESTVAAVDHGHAAVGIINQYYWYRLRLEQGAANTHSKLYFFPNRDVGAIENVGGAAVLASSHHKSEAQQFLSFIVSTQGQQILSQGDDYEYPVRPDVAANPELVPLAQVNPAVLNVVSLGDDLQSAALIQQVGLT